MGTDEAGTLARLKARRRELVDPKIAEHRGRIVKTTGDGMLVEFASVSTLCAAPSTCNTPCRIAMPMSRSRSSSSASAGRCRRHPGAWFYRRASSAAR
jgi:class 3 adenylate cyclase